MYLAVSSVTDPTHITCLQRVMWRIYINNIEDETTLVASWEPKRGKSLTIRHTNPLSLDYETASHERMQNIHLKMMGL